MHIHRHARFTRRTFDILVGVVLAVGAVGAVTPSALAHSPTTGGSKGDFDPFQVILFRWAGSGYPEYVNDAYRDALNDNWPNDTWNNSKSPVFSGSQSTGTADMFYTAALLSPCGTGNAEWIQCARNWGTPFLDVHVRDFGGAPFSNWQWRETNGACTTSNCWYMRRALIHELGHAVLSLEHDSQTEDDTVMRSISPEYTATGGATTVLRKCDEARAQLVWDVKNFAAQYGNCFDHILGHGPSGLQTEVRVTGSSFHACNGQSLTVTGRSEILNLDSYGPLGRNPLAGRTVQFDRGSTVNYTSTVSPSSSVGLSDNWSKSFGGSNVTYTWTAHFDDVVGDGLDDSPGDSFTTSWSAAC